jgi:pSer/pThr/pTyr-binding forkhead associated (FHA) protein
VVCAGGETGAIIELNNPKVMVGSGPDCQVRLDDSSVGSTHALIRARQGSFSLTDLGSRSGTWVNGQLEAGVVLKDGSRISIGSSELSYTQVAAGGNGAEDARAPAEGVLLVRSGPSMGQSFRAGQGDLVLGRQPRNGGARIDDPAVSQRHAILRQMPRGARLYDLGSSNGTRVDDVELEGVLLQNSDILKFGQAEVQFVHEDAD